VKDSDVLHAASEIVARGHTKGAYARRPDGTLTSPGNPEANCFCLVGSIMRALGTESVAAADGIVEKWVVPLIPKRHVHANTLPGSARGWNDSDLRKPEDVALLLRAAVDAAMSKGE